VTQQDQFKTDVVQPPNYGPPAAFDPVSFLIQATKLVQTFIKNPIIHFSHSL